MKQITANIYVEDQFSVLPAERGCNPGFITTSEGVVMVDTPMMPTDAIKWRNEIAKRGEVRYIINTHHHPDHITGNYFFAGTVVSHQEVREMFKAPITGKVVSQAADKVKKGTLSIIENIRLDITERDPEGAPLLEHYHLRMPTITFSEKLNLYVGEQIIELIHQPGHTAGHIGIFIPGERVFFTGDNFTNGVQPLLSHCLPLEWVDSLKRIETMDVEIVVPGHGKVCGKKEVREFRLFIEKCIDIVREAIKQGISQEKAADTISFENLYPAIHPGAEQQHFNVLRLYEMLAK